MGDVGLSTDPNFDQVAGLTTTLEETLSNLDGLRDWILSKHRVENRQDVLDEHPLALPPELPYGELVGTYDPKPSQVVTTRCCGEDTVTTFYRHEVLPPKLPELSAANTMSIKRRWLDEARRGPIPKSPTVLFREVHSKKWLALSYEQEMRVGADTDRSDGVQVRSAKMTPGTLENVVSDSYVVDLLSGVGDLWHDGCMHPTGTGLWDTVGGVLPYVAPNATVVKVPCSKYAPHGTWLFPRSKGKEETFVSAMITLLGTGHSSPLTLQTGSGRKFMWSGLEGFRPEVKLGGSDRFWLRIEQMAGILRGNMVVGRNAAASVLWAMSWFRTLLEGMRDELGRKDSTTTVLTHAVAPAVIERTKTLRRPVGICAAAIASMLGLELDSLVEDMEKRLRDVWQQWRLALGKGKVEPNHRFKQSLIVPLENAEMYDKDDAVKVTLFFMYIVQRLAERNETLLNAAQHYGTLSYMQPYAALAEILRPSSGFAIEVTDHDIFLELLRLVDSYDTHEEWELDGNQFPFVWRRITDGNCFAGSLTTSKTKTQLLNHCLSHRVTFLRDRGAPQDALSAARVLKPEVELLKVFQQCKKQLWPQQHPRMGLWLSNEQGLVVVNVFSAPNRDIEQGAIAQPNNEWLVLPELVSLRNRGLGQLSVVNETLGGMENHSFDETESVSVLTSLASQDSGLLDIDRGTLQWRVVTDEGENYFSLSQLDIYQLVFRVTNESVKTNVAHLVALRRCGNGAAKVPLTPFDVEASDLAEVDGVLYGRVNLGLREMMPDGTNIKNCADDFYRLRPNGSIKAPVTAGELTAPIIQGLREDSGQASSLYSGVIDRLWKMDWH